MRRNQEGELRPRELNLSNSFYQLTHLVVEKFAKNVHVSPVFRAIYLDLVGYKVHGEK